MRPIKSCSIWGRNWTGTWFGHSSLPPPWINAAQPRWRLRICRRLSFRSVLPAPSQFFRHENPARAGRMARDLTKPAPAIALVEHRRLKADRVEHGGPAAAPPPLFLECPQNLSAETRTAQRLGQEEQIEEEQAERRAADCAADDT